MTNELEKDPVREFLNSATEAKLEIMRHRMRAEELECRCTKVTASMSGMPEAVTVMPSNYGLPSQMKEPKNEKPRNEKPNHTVKWKSLLTSCQTATTEPSFA